MTIQNIEDVMERIMSLNRNLNEESLKTLLSASGWDREDILEGLRIFRATNKNTVAATPIGSRYVSQDQINDEILEPKSDEEVLQEDILQEKPYTFNLKKKEDSQSETEEASKKSALAELTIPLPGKTKVLEKDKESDSETGVENFMNPKEGGFVSETDDSQKTGKQKKKRSRRLVSLILLLIAFLLLAVAGAYLYIPTFSSWINETFSIRTKQNIIVQDVDRAQVIRPDQNQNISNDSNTNKDPDYTTTASSTDAITIPGQSGEIVTPSSANIPDDQLTELTQEIERLKADLNNYKNSIPESKTQTIVRYISQKGPTGATGRGILSVDATSTGFIINYTDNTNEIVPYSTSTLVGILNSQQVCFRDMNATTTSSSTDICLDKNTVTNLLNR
ncbi:MAG: hypothetical protein PHQ01_03650 [Candidatus Pacebacteria bacterium]|nr:hypothetical protein [Candidatus Paceibacterota bacterium]